MRNRLDKNYSDMKAKWAYKLELLKGVVTQTIFK